MLPLENLDKKSFKEILKESRKNIHRFSSEWTDENYHDPGITLLEMFSWLTEMQRYYLNRVTDKNNYEFLKIYGIELEKQTLGSTYVTFEGINSNKILPKGMKLLAEDQVFETTNILNLTSNKIEKLITTASDQEVDNTYVSSHKGIYFYPFGEVLEKGNKLYIGFKEKFHKNQIVEMVFNVFSSYPVELNGTNLYNYGTKTKCYTYTVDKAWEKINLINDDTQLFSKTGAVSLIMDKDMEKKAIDMSCTSYYWIMLEVEEFGAHVSPRIDNIMLNTTRVINKNTLCRVKTIEDKVEKIKLKEYLDIYGTTILQHEIDGWWYDIDKDYYKKTYLKEKGIAEINFYDDYDKIRIISYDELFKDTRIIGYSDGLANQQIPFKSYLAIPRELKLQVGQLTQEGMKWLDFNYVDSLTTAGPYDNVFTLNTNNEKLIFGDGENGAIPPAGRDNIRIVELTFSDKERGNVKEGEIKEFVREVDEFRNIRVRNIKHATGGSSPMTIRQGKKAVIDDYKKIYRAVSIKDYESLVMEMPGIRIAKACAVPSDGNTVSIIVVPYTETKNPLPDERLLHIVEEYLDEYRLITTNVVAQKPSYVEVFVKCVISTENNNKFNKIEFEKKINNYLSPIVAGKIDNNYKIGSPVYKSEILRIINEFEGVKYVKKLWIDAKGRGVKRDKNGNIYMNTNGIYFCGQVEVELID